MNTHPKLKANADQIAADVAKVQQLLESGSAHVVAEEACENPSLDKYLTLTLAFIISVHLASKGQLNKEACAVIASELEKASVAVTGLVEEIQ